MLTLYHSPGSFSIAAHIVLEESGERYESNIVDLRKGEQRSEAFRKINPRGHVPALRLDNGEVITENTAILPYLGKRFNLWPVDLMAEARALSLIGFFASSVASAHARAAHAERYVLDPAAIPTVKAAALQAFYSYLKEIDALLAGKQWFFDVYSVCDPYGFSFYSWGLRDGFPMGELRHYTAFKDRMLQRPAVQRVAERENLKI